MQCLICGAAHIQCRGLAREPMSIIDLPREKIMTSEKDFVATEPLYLNKEGKVVGHKDPSKAEKLADVGHRIPYERAKELGLIKDEVKEDATQDMSWTADEGVKVKDIAHNLNDDEGEEAPPSPPDLSEMSKAELADYAKSLGIDVKSSWGMAKITEEIEAVQAN